MEYINISENKMKIILTKRDMIEYGLLGIGDNYDTPKIRCSFKRILEKAEIENKKSFLNEKTLIQFYEGKCGGELFVTKLGVISQKTEAELKKSVRVSLIENKTEIFSFASENDLKQLFSSFSYPLTLYLLGGTYYTVIDEGSGGSIAGHISEFAERVPSAALTYIKEHGEKIENSIFK